MSGFVEVVGIASVMPFIAIASNPEAIQENEQLLTFYNLIGPSSVENFILILGLASLAAITLSNALRATTEYAQARFAAIRANTISSRLLEDCLHRPYVWFLNRHSADIGQSILSEVQQVVSGVMVPGLQLLAKSVTASAIVVLLVVVEPVITLVAASGIGGSYAILYATCRKYLSRIGADRVAANRERYRIAQEATGGIKEIKVAGLERAYITRFRESSSRFARRQASAVVFSTLPRYAMETIVFGGMILLSIFFIISRGGQLAEVLPVLGLFAFAGYRLLPALNQIFQAFTKLRFNEPALDHICRDICSQNKESEMRASSTARTQKLGLNNRIELTKVYFTYPEARRPALRDLTLAIAARTTVGLIGASGAGKTTTADLILGLLRPQCGELCVDGVPITETNLTNWQRSIGYVPQHIFLADDTVARNIAFGVPEERIDQAAVERAARMAQLHHFTVQELPKGYQTMVGERGVRLSGGQRQRIGIARALYSDPDVLIFDEATSALDNLTEQVVMDAIHKLTHRKTIIIVAHRLTTVRQCDQIFMLDGGRLSASGTYDQLLRSSRDFHTLATMQA